MSDELPKKAERLAESMGEALHYAGLLSPGEARQWIEETKDDMREVDENE